MLTFRRALRSPEYWLLVVTTLAAMFGVPWWIAVPLATAGLSISSLLSTPERKCIGGPERKCMRRW